MDNIIKPVETSLGYVYEDVKNFDNDFNYLNQTEPRVISTRYGDGLQGRHNNSNLVLRPGSSQGYPTLELQISSRHWIKIRYLEQ